MNNIGFLMQAMRNPQSAIQQIMNNTELMQNPIGKNAFELYQKGDKQGLDELINNLCNANHI